MIKINNMSFGYGAKSLLYKDFNLNLEKGKIYGILGRNGSGKTTMLNIIASLLPNYLGEVKLDGVEAKSRTKDYLEKFYYLPETIREVKISVRDLVIIGRSYKSWNEHKFLELLKREGVELKLKLKSLSKGWQKKIYFYFAISVNPDFLILDEVSEGVDIINQKEIISDILEYFTEDKTVLIASHHIEEFENIINEFIIVDNGKLLFQGQKSFIESEFGWHDLNEQNEIEKEDILFEKKILDETYSLVKNRNKYSSLKFKNVDLATFLKVIIEEEN